jgi:hypothetical protein
LHGRPEFRASLDKASQRAEAGEGERLSRISPVARQEDREEHLLAAVPPGVAPQLGQQGSLPGVELQLRPVRDLRAVHHRGAGLGQGHLGLLRKGERQVPDAAEGVQGLVEARLDVRGLFGGRGEREVGSEIPRSGDHRERLVVEHQRGGVARRVERLALLGVQQLARQVGEHPGEGASRLNRGARAVQAGVVGVGDGDGLRLRQHRPCPHRLQEVDEDHG